MDSHLASTRAARIAVADKLVHHYRSGALLFPIDKLVALEKELSKDTAEVLIYDFYGNEWKFGKENYG
jgi:hypothetical protein